MGVVIGNTNYTIRDAINIVAEWSEIPPQLLLSDARQKYLQRPRAVIYHVARYHLAKSLLVIGDACHRDHSTIIHALRKWKDDETVARDAAHIFSVMQARKPPSFAANDNEQEKPIVPIVARPALHTIFSVAAGVVNMGASAIINHGCDDDVIPYRNAAFIVAHDLYGYSMQEIGSHSRHPTKWVASLVNAHRGNPKLMPTVTKVVSGLAAYKFNATRIEAFQ